MGTNYYWTPAYEVCECCGQPIGNHEPIHIGKSSLGWCFALHVHPEKGIHNLEDWEKMWSGGSIEDEYGTPLDGVEMMCVIVDRRHPRGLKRHKVDGVHCIGHGPGTYDLMIGDFS